MGKLRFWREPTVQCHVEKEWLPHEGRARSAIFTSVFSAPGKVAHSLILNKNKA